MMIVAPEIAVGLNKAVLEAVTKKIEVAQHGSTVVEIIHGISEKTGITFEQMKSRNNKHEVCVARQLAVKLIYESMKISLKDIGKIFGGRDHSSISHSRDTIQDLIDTDKNVRNIYLELKIELSSPL